MIVVIINGSVYCLTNYFILFPLICVVTGRWCCRIQTNGKVIDTAGQCAYSFAGLNSAFINVGCLLKFPSENQTYLNRIDWKKIEESVSKVELIVFKP